MRGRKACVLLGAVIVVTVTTSAATAQTYRCRSGQSTYLSERPCTTGAGSKISVYGPESSRESSRYAPPGPSQPGSIGKAPEHLGHLSPECATLNDAIRTAPARGVNYKVIGDLRTDYQAKCSEEDSEARQIVSKDRSEKVLARRSEQAVRKADQEQTQREREQCHELLRILHGKRQRLPQMNAGEKTDHERSEANYRDRCAPR